MRDYADVMSCYDLPEFSKEQLMKGYSKNIEEAAHAKLKIHSVWGKL